MFSRARTNPLIVTLLIACAALASTVSSASASPTLNGAVGVGGATITLKKSGTNVTRLVAGRYTFRVNDVSSAHNFHLTGPRVDQKTSVRASGVTTWTDLLLRVGTYTYLCDRHPTTMKKTFRVVAAS